MRRRMMWISSDFLQAGELEKDGLKELASYGYYYSDTNYMLTLQSFCKGAWICLIYTSIAAQPPIDTYTSSINSQRDSKCIANKIWLSQPTASAIRARTPLRAPIRPRLLQVRFVLCCRHLDSTAIVIDSLTPEMWPRTFQAVATTRRPPPFPSARPSRRARPMEASSPSSTTMTRADSCSSVSYGYYPCWETATG